MDEKEVKALITGWSELAKQQRRRSVSQFVLLWICFNARVAFESGKFSDRGMIDWLKTARPDYSDLRLTYDQVMAPTENNNFRRDLQTLADQGPISDPRPGRHDNVRITGPEDFPNLVEAI